MSVSSGAAIASKALDLREAHADWDALKVLDLAMAGHENSSPDFECDHPDYDDFMEPPSPFAELLRQAFGSHIDPSELKAMSEFGLDLDPDACAQAFEAESRWLEVTTAFRRRYNLWPVGE